MITAEPGPLISRPVQWFVCFDPNPNSNWIARLAPGRYKHVRAYGYVPYLHVWLFVDANFAGVELIVSADGEPARAMIASWSKDCDVVLMPRRPHENRSPTLALAGWCVPTIKRLLGLRCVAVTPDALFRRCLQHGGTLVHGFQRPSGTDPIAPADDRADHGGAAGHAAGDDNLGATVPAFAAELYRADD